jgi:cell division protein FtsQ
VALFGSNKNPDTQDEFEQRIQQRKYARKARRNRRILLVGLFVVIIITYLVTPLSRIKTPTIVGNQVYTKQEIMEKSNLVSTSFLFNAPYEEVIQTLNNDRFITSTKIYYDLFKCTIIINEITFLAYSEDDNSVNTYYLSDFTQIKETDLTSEELTHLSKTASLTKLDKEVIKNSDEMLILLFGLSKIDYKVRQMITSISLYNNDASILIFTLKSKESETEIKVVMENEKISTIFTHNKVEYLLKNAKNDCYRYGTSEKLEDIMIPSDICG